MSPTVQDLEAHKSNLKEIVDTKVAVERLLKNPDFRKVVVEGYFIHESARMVHESCDPALTAEQRADALAMAQGAGHFKRYLHVTGMMADKAAQDIEQVDLVLETMRAEELNPSEEGAE